MENNNDYNCNSNKSDRQFSKKHLLILSLSIISYIILAYNWIYLDTLNPPIETRQVYITNNIYIDVFGAIIPILFSSIFIIYLIYQDIIRFIIFLKYLFILSLTIFLLFREYDGAVMINWIYVMISSSLISTKLILKKDNNENDIPYYISINIYLLGFSLSTFSIVLIDLLYSIMSKYSYIGVAGFVDVIFLSSIFVFIPTFILLSFLNLFPYCRKYLGI